ncbi:hypothetical protein TNCV_898591 [Trichonephila clavipes]|nr:hypothetical protein TNCV_898591 [Trichonephila clavipes]
MAPRLPCAKGAVHILARVTNEGRKVRSGYLPFRTNASTLPITPRRSSKRDVGTSSFRYHTATRPLPNKRFSMFLTSGPQPPGRGLVQTRG